VAEEEKKKDGKVGEEEKKEDGSKWNVFKRVGLY